MRKRGFAAACWLIAGALYVICPFDFDFIPLVGWVDDVFVAYGCIKQWHAAGLPAKARQSSMAIKFLASLVK